MPTYAPYVVDLVAIAILVFGLFLPRHRRTELVVAFLTVNVGVLAVASALSSATIGAGLGLGLFGILSIIRLRSQELSQSEIAYYFAALALGLLGGLGTTFDWLDVTLMGAVVLAVAVGDLPRLGQRTTTQQMVLDRAFLDHDDLVDHLAALLGGEVVDARVLRTDLVNDTTLVDVRHRADGSRGTARTQGMPAMEMLR